MNKMTRPGPGKFEGNESLEVSELLYEIVGDGMADDEIGDVESYGWHALLTDVDKSDALDSRYPFRDENGKNIEVLPAYIVSEDNDGFFSYHGFELNTQARDFWQSLVRSYAELIDEVSVI